MTLLRAPLFLVLIAGSALASPEVSPSVSSSVWEVTERAFQTKTSVTLPGGILERTRTFMGMISDRAPSPVRLVATPSDPEPGPLGIEIRGASKNGLSFTTVMREHSVQPLGFDLTLRLRASGDDTMPVAELRVRISRRGKQVSSRWEGPFPVLPLQPLRALLPSVRVSRGAASFKVPGSILERLFVHAERTGQLRLVDTARLRTTLLTLSLRLSKPDPAVPALAQRLQKPSESKGCEVRLLAVGPESTATRWRRILRFDLAYETYYVVVVMTPKRGEVSGPYLELPDFGTEIPDPTKPPRRSRK